MSRTIAPAALMVLCLLFASGPVLASDGENPGEGGAASPGSSITLPVATGKNVFISQVGQENRTSVEQHTEAGYASVAQQGENNNAEVVQHGVALTYADVSQGGIANYASVAQSGLAPNVVHVGQEGNDNRLISTQSNAGAIYNAARMSQTGDGNVMSLTQSGDDNQADLAQVGNDNSMFAEQTGAGNRLEWTQQGDNLSAPTIIQTGGSSIEVTQTGG